MSDSIRITSPVKIDNHSKEDVALKLMQTIYSAEVSKTEINNPRDYFLKLYCQCLSATTGVPFSHIDFK